MRARGVTSAPICRIRVDGITGISSDGNLDWRTIKEEKRALTPSGCGAFAPLQRHVAASEDVRPDFSAFCSVRNCAVDILFFDWIQMDVIGTLTMSLLFIDPLAYRVSLDEGPRAEPMRICAACNRFER
jgi:hypothetical protein